MTKVLDIRISIFRVNLRQNNTEHRTLKFEGSKLQNCKTARLHDCKTAKLQNRKTAKLQNFLSVLIFHSL
jgi:hypothetical protein